MLVALAVLVWPVPGSSRGPSPGRRRRQRRGHGSAAARRRPPRWCCPWVGVGGRLRRGGRGRAGGGARPRGGGPGVGSLTGCRRAGAVARTSGWRPRTRRASRCPRASSRRWRPSAEERRDLALLVAAWRLAEEVGAGAADVTAAAARRRAGAPGRGGACRRRRRGSEGLDVAAHRAAAGSDRWPGCSSASARPPVRLRCRRGSRPRSGVLLTAAGWWWARTLLARARRSGRTAGGPA